MQDLPPLTERAMRALLRPRHPDFDRFAADVYGAAEDLQRAFSGPDDLEFLTWLATHGRAAWPELAAAHYPPEPPEAIRVLGCTGNSSLAFGRSGIKDAELILFLQEVFGTNHLAEGGTVYDFGSGAGRVLRWLGRLPRVRAIGSDVLSGAIGWCSAHLDGEWFVSSRRPPLPLASESCDVVYALSIFSHFGASAATAWMRELARICRKDGLIIITTHGPFSLAVLARSHEHQAQWGVSAPQALALLRGLERDGHAFVPYSDAVYARWPEVDRAEWGQAFLSEAWARTAFTEFAECIGTVPAALNLIQDALCFRPR